MALEILHHPGTSPSQKCKLVVQEIGQQEEAARCAKAVAQPKQGQWMSWEGVEKKKISWHELWETKAFRTSFTIKAAYNVLLSPKNLSQLYVEDPTCSLCPTPATLKQILVGCKTSPHSRLVHLAAQPGATVSCSSGRRSANEHQCPSSLYILLANNSICPGR